MATIVVGVDGSEASKAALRFALEEARLRQSSLRVVCAWKHAAGGLYTYCTGGPGSRSPGPPKSRAQREQERLRGFVRKVVPSADVEMTQSAVEGDPARVLLEAAKDAELLVVGSRGQGGFAGLLLCSVSQQCAHHAPCTGCDRAAAASDEVAGGVVSRERGERMATIVVGVDGSSGARPALRFAVREARLRGATVRVVTAWHVPAMAYGGGGFAPGIDPTVFEENASTAQEEALAALGEQASDVEIERVIRIGQPAEVLVEAAAGADLLVVGSRGHGGFTGLLLGSVSQQVAHHAPCPVVIVGG